MTGNRRGGDLVMEIGQFNREEFRREVFTGFGRQIIRTFGHIRKKEPAINQLHLPDLLLVACFRPVAKAASISLVLKGLTGPDSRACITHLACSAEARASSAAALVSTRVGARCSDRGGAVGRTRRRVRSPVHPACKKVRCALPRGARHHWLTFCHTVSWEFGQRTVNPRASE